MKALSDKAILFRTYPIVPRKRIKFDPDEAVEFSEFGSGIPAFKCRGGYFTQNSYRLFDYFVSHWFEIARRNWTVNFGGQYDVITSQRSPGHTQYNSFRMVFQDSCIDGILLRSWRKPWPHKICVMVMKWNLGIGHRRSVMRWPVSRFQK